MIARILIAVAMALNFVSMVILYAAMRKSSACSRQEEQEAKNGTE